MGKWKKVVAALVAIPMLAALPATANAADEVPLEENGGIVVTNDAVTLADDVDFGTIVNVTGGWIGSSATDGVPTAAVASFADPSVFTQDEWTLNADIKVTDTESTADNWNKKAAFTIGTKAEAINLLLGNGKLGYGKTDGGYSGATVNLTKAATVGEWAAVSVVYTENADSGEIAVYMDGEEALAPTEIGFKFSEQQNTAAYIGHGYNTSFVLNGVYDAITVADTAATADAAKADTAARLAAKQTASAIPGAGEHGNNGYLWLNFKATDYEKVNYGYSADGTSWKMLNDGDPIMTSTQGTKGIRDPHLLKLNEPDADGNQYVMLGTDLHAEGSASGGSWDQINASTDLVIAKSKDLVTWTEPKLVSTGLEGKVGNAWAPEAMWDEASGDYLVYWSSRDLSTGGDNPTTSNTALKVYKAHTTDFESFTDAEVWLDQSAASLHNIIDTTIIQGDDGDYYRFSTSDWWTTVDVASELEGEWTRLIERDSEITADGTSMITGDKVISTTASGLSTRIEGLTAYQLNSGQWMVMGDNGGYKGFTIDRLSDLKRGRTFTAASGVSFNQTFRHGTVVELTAAEQQAVLAAYSTDDVAPVTPDEDGAGPIAQYDFEDESNPGKDTTGNGNDLTLNGKASRTTDDAKGNVLYLDGGSKTSVAYAEFPQGMFDGRNKLTVQMDVTSEINANQFTFTFGKDTNKYYFLKYNNSGELASRITVNSYGSESYANASVTGNGAWHKVTITLDDNVMTLYCDGAQVAQETSTSAKVTDLGKNLLAYLGKSFYDDDYFKGAFDNVAVWNRALSADEVAETSPVAMQTITVGDVPTTDEANALRGTDDHTTVRSALDWSTKTVTAAINRRGEASATPLTVTFNRGADSVALSVDGEAFANGDTIDLTQDRTLTIDYGDGEREEWTIKAVTVANNPVLPGQYADPDIDYFDGKFWIYPTTDGFSGWSGNYFHAFSSTDLLNWTDEGVILDVNRDHQPTTDGDEDTAISPWSVGSAWAPTIEKKNGKYYFYYCAKLPNGTSAIGVAVADSPAGPYTAADEPLVTNNMEGVTVGQAIDPSIYTDPDTGKSYMLYGNGSAAILELGDDMMSVVPGSVRRLSGLTDFRESVVVAKRDGVYHWTWSCDDAGSANYHVNYGTSTSLDGAITYHGTILQKDSSQGLQGTAHQSDVHVIDADGNERWFMAYHRHYTPLGVFTSGLGYHRETAIEEITFGDDGLMETMTPSDEGVGAVEMADVTALNGAIAAAGNVTDDGYTDETWTAFETAFADAQTQLQEFLDHGLAQRDVDAAATALTDAIAALDKGEEPGPDPEPEGDATLKSLTVAGHVIDLEAAASEDGAVLKIADPESLTVDDVVVVTNSASALLTITVSPVEIWVTAKDGDAFMFYRIVLEKDDSGETPDPEPDPVITSIEVMSMPTTTEYTVGEEFDADGLTLMATMDDGAVRTLDTDEYVIGEVDMTTAGTKTVTVTLRADSSVTTSFEITVKAETPDPEPEPEPTPVLESIKVTAPPTKVTYAVGEAFDATGLEVTGYFANADGTRAGTSRVLDPDEYELFGFDSSKISDKVTVTVQSTADPTLIDTFTVAVKAADATDPTPEPDDKPAADDDVADTGAPVLTVAGAALLLAAAGIALSLRRQLR